MEYMKSATDKAENAFDALGMGSGPMAPVVRAAVGFALTTAIWGYLDPKLFNVSYMPDGSARPWALTAKQGDSSPTLVPWFLPGAGVAIICGGFI